MDKVDVKDLTKAVNSLVGAIKEQSRQLEKLNQSIKENTDALKEMRTRIGSILNTNIKT